MARTVLVGMLVHETNTFVDEPTDLAAFRARGEHRGADLLEYYRGTNTELGGVVEAAGERDFDLLPTVGVEGFGGGTVTRAAYDHYAGDIVAAAREHADRVEGSLLVLHGAMVAEGADGGEAALVDRVRAATDAPVVCTLDLHGNPSDALVEAADALVAFETNPHLDKAATGRRATALLDSTMRGDVSPAIEVERPPILPHPPRLRTAEDPMAAVMARARDAEERPGVLRVNVLPGFHRADVPHAGFSVPVVADGDAALARDVAREMAAFVWEERGAFVGDYPRPEEAVAEAERRVAAGDTDEGPVVLADMGPQPGGGGTADGTPTLRALLDAEVGTAGYAVMCDPEAVAACIEAGVGERVAPTVGGKTDDRHGDPIRDLDGYVRAITDGVYVNTGDSHVGTGVETRLGRTVRFQCGRDDDVAVVLCEQPGFPFDRELWRHVGLPPERLDVVALTSTAAFRGDYGDLASHVIEVDSPGLSSPFPERFDYERVRRPIFPLEDVPGYPDW